METGHRQRRIVGLDLGVASRHTAQVLDEQVEVIAKRRVEPTVEGFTTLEQAALAGADPGTRLEVVIEPTGAAWLPVAVWFTRRGHTVFRVSTQKAADLRRFLSRHAKSNSIDAHTLARLPLIDPDGLTPVALPATAAAATLDRRVRAAARLTDEIGTHKRRLIELARQAIPTIGTVLASPLSRTDLAVLERYADPRRLAAVRPDRLTALIHRVAHGHGDPAAKAEAFRSAARAALDLYGDHAAISFDSLADEITTEIRLIRTLETERDRHTDAREHAYRTVDATQLARTLPGIATTGGPILVAVMGDPHRFPNAAAFKSYVGLAPRASETGNTDRKGQPMSKAGNRRLRTQLIRSAETARQLDPQLAAVYHDQMVHKGAVHTKALAVVAARLAERAWTVMARNSPYELRDLHGNPVDPATARRIITDHYTVPDHIRRQRRSHKSGKAPHSAQRSPRRPSQPKHPTSHTTTSTPDETAA
ncbi:transposase [Salsipaludibacter albus]|uniref:transposase n=1 Tax=Salsipaludibacter albus TaxID=2849650 RepID=UPI002367CD26|nr:transposase [Salsipaludibacter albus]MBY5163117.1 transposase [Salsipaludibacter albus]